MPTLHSVISETNKQPIDWTNKDTLLEKAIPFLIEKNKEIDRVYENSVVRSFARMKDVCKPNAHIFYQVNPKFYHPYNPPQVACEHVRKFVATSINEINSLNNAVGNLFANMNFKKEDLQEENLKISVISGCVYNVAQYLNKISYLTCDPTPENLKLKEALNTVVPTVRYALKISMCATALLFTTNLVLGNQPSIVPFLSIALIHNVVDKVVWSRAYKQYSEVDHLSRALEKHLLYNEKNLNNKVADKTEQAKKNTTPDIQEIGPSLSNGTET